MTQRGMNPSLQQLRTALLGQYLVHAKFQNLLIPSRQGIVGQNVKGQAPIQDGEFGTLFELHVQNANGIAMDTQFALFGKLLLQHGRGGGMQQVFFGLLTS